MSDPSRPGSGDERDPMAEVIARVQRITEENRLLFQRLITGQRRFRGLAKSVWQVQEAERRRLARELHDGLGQILTALKNQLDRAARESPDGDTRRRFEESAELAARALAEARELSRLLRPPVLDDLGLEPALRWLGRTLFEGSGVEVALTAELGERPVPPDLQTLVFRVTQEALTNVAKHARADRVEVVLRRGGPGLELTVADDGRGFDPTTPEGGEVSGIGLAGIRDRVELFGGSFSLEARLGAGTRIEVHLPVDDGEAPGEEGEPE